MGGADSNGYGYSSSMMFHDNEWSWGPQMTSVRNGHCSCTLGNMVITTGGNIGYIDLNLVEMFNWTSRSWSTLPAMQHARIHHRCSIVWLLDDGTVSSTGGEAFNQGVVVAGGESVVDIIAWFHSIIV